MKVTETNSGISGVPDYYLIYKMWNDKFEKTGDPRSRTLALHYVRVAEEMGQVSIEDDTTQGDMILEKW